MWTRRRSAREGKSRLKTRQYEMVITDMRMESDEAGREVIVAARTAPYHPAVALLTAFPVAEEDWQDMGADKMLVKPMQTRILIRQIEKLLETHQAKLKKLESLGAAAGLAAGFAAGMAAASVQQVQAGEEGSGEKSRCKESREEECGEEAAKGEADAQRPVWALMYLRSSRLMSRHLVTPESSMPSHAVAGSFRSAVESR